jgi:hypothetical protein
MTSFLSTFSISASLTRHVIELLSSWRTSEDAFAHNLPLPQPDRFRPSHCRSTSLGISKTPLYRHPFASTVPKVPKHLLRSAVAKRLSPSAHRVSHPLDGLLLTNFHGPIASRYRFRVRCVLSTSENFLPKLSTIHSPQRHSHPLKHSPSLQPHPVTRALASSSLAPDSIAETVRINLEALLRKQVRCFHQTLPPDFRPLLSWALFPSRALPSKPVLHCSPKRTVKSTSLRCLTSLPLHPCRNTNDDSTRPTSEDHPSLKVASFPCDHRSVPSCPPPAETEDKPTKHLSPQSPYAHWVPQKPKPSENLCIQTRAPKRSLPYSS